MGDSSSITVAATAPAGLTPGQQAWRRFVSNRPAVAGAVLLSLLLLAILVGPSVCSHRPEALSDALLEPPGWTHWFGTDAHGRDLLVRVLYGTRISLAVGAVGTAVSLVIGVLWGATSGYVGGRLDNVMMRIVDVLYALPSIVFVIVLITTLNGFLDRFSARGWSPSAVHLLQLTGLFAGLGAVSWLTMARIVRGEVLGLRHRAYVEAAVALGAGHWHVLRRHIIPNMAGIVIVYLALTVPSVVLYESFLSFLGLGIQPPQASLGSLIAEGAIQINPIRVCWWLIVIPGGTLAVALLALNFLGDGLRDALSPRSDMGR